MKLQKVFFLILVLALIIPRPSFAIDPDEINARANLIKALAEKRRAEFEEQIAHAEVRLLDATTAQVHQEIRHWQTVLRILREEYDKIKRLDVENEAIITELRNLKTASAELVRGRMSSTIFSKITTVLIQGVNVEAYIKLMSTAVPSLGVENFVSNDIWEDVTESFGNGPLRSFVRFLLDNDYSTQPQSEGHMVLLSIFGYTASALDQKEASITRQIDAARARALNVFNTVP